MSLQCNSGSHSGWESVHIAFLLSKWWDLVLFLDFSYVFLKIPEDLRYKTQWLLRLTLIWENWSSQNMKCTTTKYSFANAVAASRKVGFASGKDFPTHFSASATMCSQIHSRRYFNCVGRSLHNYQRTSASANASAKRCASAKVQSSWFESHICQRSTSVGKINADTSSASGVLSSVGQQCVRNSW